jgi:hypothetical protein
MGVRVHTPAHRRIVPERRKLAIKASFMAVILAAMTFTLAQANADAAYSTVQPSTFSGYAFDACAAPPSASMTAWKASPYKAIGIYIGGVSRGCAQPNLTAAWVKAQVTAGWKLLPLYVGPQATCAAKKNQIDNASPIPQGRAAAADAAVQAASLGLAKQSVIIYDLEAYDTTDATCRKGVLGFLNGWTSALHDLGYLSGFYSSAGSGVVDQVANYSASGYTPPDYIDFARWDSTVTTNDANIPSTMWIPHRRMKQYRGGHPETFGGVTINVDSNYVDYALPPAAKMADFNNSGWSDVLAKSPANGWLYLYPGTGRLLSTGTRRALSSGWNSMNAITRVGDLNRDGREDVVARQTNGYLWFYPGTTTGFGARKKIGSGWSSIREITGVGDFNKDGYPDLVAAQGANLYLYPGKSGTALGTRKLIGQGVWSGRSEVAGVGDFNRDGRTDFVARDNATGILWAYPGAAGGKIGARWSLGAPWGGVRDVVGVGDFDRDGYPDIVAVRKSDSALMLFRGTGKALRAGVVINGFGGLTPLA